LRTSILENLGYVVNASINDTPRYRIMQEFVRLVLTCGTASH